MSIKARVFQKAVNGGPPNTQVRTVIGRVWRGRLSRNALFAAGQGIFAMACMLIVYRLTIQHAGLEQFGIWSLLVAFGSVIRLFDVSGGGALARFVASSSRGDAKHRAVDYVHTVLILSLILNLGLSLAMWIVAPFALALFLSAEYVDDALVMVPWVIALTALGSIAYAPISAIDGTQRADQRALVVMFSSGCFVVFGAFMIPAYGIAGFAAALVFQQLLWLTLGWIILRWHVPDLGWFPTRWRLSVASEVTGYALRLNAIGIITLLFEPMAKLAFNGAGGPSLVAVFDLALRLVTQLRSVIVSAAAPLSPAFAAHSNPSDPEFQTILARSTRLAAFASIGLAVLTSILAPIVSLIVFGEFSFQLLSLNAALAAGWAINTIAIPMYFAAQGRGILRWNFIGQAMSTITVATALFFASENHAILSVVVAIFGGLSLGASLTLFGNAAALGVLSIVRREHLLIFVSVAAILLFCSLSIVLYGFGFMVR